MGVIGEQGSLDFTVLGDTANTTARLGSAVTSGELAMSQDIVTAADISTDNMEHRAMELKGKTDPVAVWIETTAPSAN